MKILFLAIITICTSFSSKISAQSYLVKPITSFTTEYQGKHKIILDYVESRTDLTLQQKLVLYQNELNKLKSEFRNARKQEYGEKSIKLSVAHSCSKGSSGGVKDCGWKSVSAPIEHLYTKASWISVQGTNKGTRIDGDGSGASLRMTRAGQGVNKGTLSVEFRYRPESVLSLLESDTDTLFSEIVK